MLNGEIFNYVELRNDLKRKGYQFRTDSDTEVISYLYREYGTDFVHEINGQFAISIWDELKQRLILVRDRPGIVPLFYHADENSVIFGSEIKALRPALDQGLTIDQKRIVQTALFWGPIAPHTMFKEVHSVRPGRNHGLAGCPKRLVTPTLTLRVGGVDRIATPPCDGLLTPLDGCEA